MKSEFRSILGLPDIGRSVQIAAAETPDLSISGRIPLVGYVVYNAGPRFVYHVLAGV